MQDQLIEDREYEAAFDIERDAVGMGTGVIPDPYPQWAELLAKGAVQAGTLSECMGLPAERSGSVYLPGFTYFSVFSFAACSEVFVRKDDFDSHFYHDIGLPMALGDNILSMDGLRHRRYRNVIQAYFQPAAAQGWWRDKAIAGTVEEIVGNFEHLGAVDLNTQLCARLPIHTVAAAFGLSAVDGVDFRRHVQESLNSFVSPQARAAATQASEEILIRNIHARQASPQDDIISRLAGADLEDEDGSTRRLTAEEIAAFCRVIVFAGSGTTWRQLGATIFALLSDREQFDLVRNDRGLVQNALLESTRWFPNDPLFVRKAKHDTTLQGVDIPKGAIMHLCLGAANRDVGSPGTELEFAL